ncbi:MAG: hypothetical protein A2Y17_06595 [Clostridiales bacterium GWF2_38_85]|nr:MAG: hypothetical protein A2Y17_06595 [Clostridiales bacterium GWF2_38_85]HBL84883.1 PolC-type DNA polymerase III [Clostridiales bacterium]
MTASEKFLKTFSKFNPTPKQQELICCIDDIKVRVNKAAKAIECDIDFSKKISLDLLSELENDIREQYEIISVIFLPSYKTMTWEQFSFNELIMLVKKYFGSVVNGFFTGAKDEYSKKRNIYSIILADGHSADLLYSAQLDRMIETTFTKVFDTAISVKFVGDADEDYRPSGLEELEQDAARVYEQYQTTKNTIPDTVDKSSSLDPIENGDEVIISDDETILQSGRMIFDISEPKTIMGKKIRKKISPIRTITAAKDNVAVCGEVVSVESKETRDQTKVRFTIYITDNDSSIGLKFIEKKEDIAELKGIKEGYSLLVSGTAKIDKFDGELILDPNSISQVKRIRRKDTAEKPRVELHLHTNMSTMDGLCKPDEVISLAKDWNMPAIAVTDHGNVQGYPEMMLAAEKQGVKVIYGMEGYLVDDTARIIYGGEKIKEKRFNEDCFIIFDIETTGLSPVNCGITEIGAVRYKGGEIIEVFETYVNPQMPIPQNITELTGITDGMVADAPHPKDAVKAFLNFAGNEILIAHNAQFDIGFIRKATEDYSIPFNNPYLDTLTLSRFLNPELSRHKLDSLRDYFKLGEFNHHRASDDTKMLAAIFEKMVQKLKADGISSIAEMETATENKANPKKLRPYHISILVQNKTGLYNLYKLISQSYLEYFHRSPRIPKTLLLTNRNGLLIGTACQAGELYNAVLEGKNTGELKKIASFYDYFEIMPIENNIFLVNENKVGTDRESGLNELRRMNKVIYNLGKSMNKPVVATGDVHYVDPEDEIYRQILQFGMKFSDADKESKLYLKTTEEMLVEFEYLGKDAAYEVVVENTRKIADIISADVRPIPKGSFNPSIENSDNNLREMCYKRAMELYGYNGEIPKLVTDRLDKELNSVITNGFSALYISAREIVKFSERNGYQVGSRGSVGSSIIAALAEISEVNPLPPHRRCPKCKYTDFITDSSIGSGFDMDNDTCPKCGETRVCDGHDIPFETFLGFKGEKAPDIDLNFSGEVQAGAHKFTEVLFGENNVFRAGTIGTLASKTAYGFVKKYLEDKGKNLTKAEENRLIAGCMGVKRTTGQHPGGIVVVPKPYSIYDFTPVQHPADKSESDIITTHFDFNFMHDTLQKLDILGHDVPTKYKVLEELTGIDVKTIPLNDRKVMSLFLSTEALGITPKEAGVEIGTLGIPECGTKYVRQMMVDAQPKCFSDLLQISGLSHGEGIWIGNGKDLIDQKICTISEIIGTRDSIMLYLIKYGLDAPIAFKITEDVRKGRGLRSEYIDVMRENNVPEWYIESCKKIKYMFPKAHAAAYMIAALRLAWYKVYQPLAFYSCYFTVQPEGIDAETVMQSRQHILKCISELAEKGVDVTQKEEDTLTALGLVNEMFARKIKFLPVNIFKSHKTNYMPEDGNIRLPLSSINGLGTNAAEKIYSCIHEEKVSTLAELKIKASLSQSVVDTLTKNDCLGDMPETEQITLW